MMELLLAQGADVNAVDSAGRSALHLACQRSFCANAVLLLISHKASQETFLTLVNCGVRFGRFVHFTLDDIQKSHFHGRPNFRPLKHDVFVQANANTGDNLGRTPLHEVCERGHTEILQSLIYQKINLRVNAEASNGGRLRSLNFSA